MLSKLIASFKQAKISDVFSVEKYSASKLSQWFIQENSYNNYLLTDIKDVDYNKCYINKNVKLQPITSMFCDNIMIFTIIPQEQTEKLNKLIRIKVYLKQTIAVLITLY